MSCERNLSSFFDDKLRIAATSSCIGLGLVVISILLSRLLDWPVLFSCVLIFAEILLFGNVLSFGNPKKRSPSTLASGKEVTDGEIRAMLERKGLDKLVRNSEED